MDLQRVGDSVYTPKWLSNSVTDITKAIGSELSKNEALVEGSKTMNKGIEAAGDIVDTSFDIFSWVKNNWQIAVVGLVALLVLLRD